MLQFIPPQQMTEAQFALLCESGQRPPHPANRFSAQDIARSLLSGQWQAYSCPGGVFAIEVVGTPRRMVVTALNITRFGWRLRSFRDWLDRLATDLMCDTVETTCFDERLALAMMRIKARPEAWQMVWQVEGRQDHGQQEKN